MSDSGRPIEILLVEDDPGDVRLTLEALVDSKVCNAVHVARDGDAALAFVHSQGEYADARRPDLILLDLGLPKTGGLAVLAAVRALPALQDVPVLVVTGSRAEADILRSYELRVDGYLVKPVDFRQLLAFVQSFAGFGLAIVTARRPASRQPSAVGAA